ncbi:MAG: T9SS type A sorting domain-containing protein [Bacteroidia bacterium]
MKKALTILFISMSLIGMQDLLASHIRAVTMYHDCVTSDTINLKVVHYQDCPVFFPSAGLVRVEGTAPGCTSPTIIGTWAIATTVDVTPVCAGVVTNCNGPGNALPGFAERMYTADWDFSTTSCNQYEASWDHCCRQLTTANSSSDNVFVDGLMIDLSLAICNNAPRFLNPPTMFICAGTTTTIEHQVYDPDGDSLAFALISCQGASGAISYNPGYSATAPLGSTWTTSLDAATGDLTFTANQGVAVSGYVCVEVSEYRNGVKIGATTMDYRVDAGACSTNGNNIPVIDSLYTIQNVTQTGAYELEAYVGDTISFGLLASDLDASDVLSSRLDSAQRVFNATLAINGTNPQTIEVTWIAGSLGRQAIRVFSHDQHCPIPGGAWRTVVINIVPQTPPPPLMAFYPGDANLDGIVDQADVLALGLAYNAVGSNSTVPTFDTTWQAFSRVPWTNSFIFGGNYAYADCDASGSVDALDRNIVDRHFGQNHMQGNYTPMMITGNGAPLSVTVDADTFNAGDSIEARIELGTMATPANGVYGVSFVLTYDTALVDSFIVSTSFANSWLGASNVLLTYDRHLEAQGQVAIAVTRTDQLPVNGFGTLADIIIIVDDVAGKKVNYLDMKLRLSDVQVITATGEQFGNVPVIGDEVVVTSDVSTSIRPDFETKSLIIFPQPANQGPVFLNLGEQVREAVMVHITDIQGREVLRQQFIPRNGRVKLDHVGSLDSGMYLVRVEAGARVWTGKMVR